MEANWKEELYFLEAYKKAIATQLNWGDSDHWRHSDFVNLSEKIFEKTGCLLSHTTLKRIWGKLKYDSLPTPNTLNTLAQYLGYETWLAFKSGIEEKRTDSSNGHLGSLNRLNLAPERKITFNRQAVLRFIIGFACIGGLLAMLIGFIFAKHKSGLSPEQIAKIKFSSQPITEGIPNTVIFNYDLDGIKSNDIQIQQSWDSTKRFRITEITNEAASTYYYPGYWRAKLLIDSKIVKEHDIFIKSNGWLVTQDLEPSPRYFQPSDLLEKDYLGVKPDVLEPLFNSSTTPEWLSYHFVEDLQGLRTDNFTFETSVKNTYIRGDGICRATYILILAQNSIIRIPLAIPGCVGDLRFRVFDYIEDGSNRDMSAFGCDFSEWQHIKCEVKNKYVKLFLNDHLIRKVSFKEDASDIMGVRLSFFGAGMVDNIAFSDENGNRVYENTFDSKD
ncbi:MAG: hypothetical protein IPJ74_10620 [Saprospiraceae bacterium]|nr:hypothetical protein [Saprospiraceae bacterium]